MSVERRTSKLRIVLMVVRKARFLPQNAWRPRSQRRLGRKNLLQDALDINQQALEISKRLAEQDKSNSGWQRDLSVGYNEVGDVLEAQGKLLDGLGAHQQAWKSRNGWPSKTNPTQAGTARSLLAFLTVATAMVFCAPLRHVGTSLLAPAGLVTVLAGVVVQRSLGHVVSEISP